MKVISFSLWGQDPKYLIGAIKNADLAAKIYPDWVCRFYVGSSVPSSITSQLEQRKNTQVVKREEWGNWESMYWRFEPSSESDVEVVISRDTDSRLSLREKYAVDQWLDSDKGFHIMRDHPWHKYPVLGGMWGSKRGTLPNMKQMIKDFSSEDAYGTDYVFFAQSVLPTLQESDIMVHDPFFSGKPFPREREGYEFVGKVFDENDITVEEHEKVLIDFLNNQGKQ